MMQWLGKLIICLGLISGMGPLWAANQYHVIGVKSWDHLNMRTGPGVSNEVAAKIPHNAKKIILTGENKTVGKTRWVKVSWQGKQGWVSQTYLAAMSITPETPPKLATPASPTPNTTSPANQSVEPLAVTPDKKILKRKMPGMWVLECGSAQPYWRVEVLPEWILGTLGTHRTGMPITYKKQDHGKYRKVALKTEIKGANRWNKLEMTLTYSRSCFSSLARKRVSFSVSGYFNKTKLTGCCRAVQVQ